MSALAHAALWSGVAAMVALVAARLWRRHDPALWNRVWVAIAAVSIALPAINAVVPAARVIPVVSGVPAGPAEAWSAPVSSAELWTLVYVAGAACFGVRLVAGLLLVGRLRRASVPVDGAGLDYLRRVAGPAVPFVRTHRRVQVPLTAGWREPVIILPETWVTWEPSRLAAIVRHELAHMERRDYGWNVLGAVYQALFWFSPAAWIVVRRIRLTAELAADRSASEAIDGIAYARILVESARELLDGRRSSVLAPGAATALDARVAALMRPAVDQRPAASPWTRRMTAAAIVFVLLASAFVRLGSASSPAATADHDALHRVRHAHR
jgi:beta-lactamase regulating signal transducer with metallopeptidase domain